MWNKSENLRGAINSLENPSKVNNSCGHRQLGPFHELVHGNLQLPKSRVFAIIPLSKPSYLWLIQPSCIVATVIATKLSAHLSEFDAQPKDGFRRKHREGELWNEVWHYCGGCLLIGNRLLGCALGMLGWRHIVGSGMQIIRRSWARYVTSHFNWCTVSWKQWRRQRRWLVRVSWRICLDLLLWRPSFGRVVRNDWAWCHDFPTHICPKTVNIVHVE